MSDAAPSQPPPQGAGAQNAILLRTHYLDDALLDYARSLRRDVGYDVIFLLDHRCAASAPGFETLAASPAAYAQLGLFCPPDVLWRCGDYGYYLAASRFKRYDHFWLIEYDVHIAGPRPASFFSELDRLCAHDFLCANFRLAEADWSWRRRMTDDAGPVHRCFFPLTRLSRRAAAHLLAERRAASESYADHPDAWPNDEVFCATTLARSGFNVADFNAFGCYYSPQTYDWSGLRHPSECVADRTTLFHPVKRGLAYQDAAEACGVPADVAMARLLDEAPQAAMRQYLIAKAAGRFLAGLGDDPSRLFGAGSPLSVVLRQNPPPEDVALLARILAHHRLPQSLAVLRARFGPSSPPIP